MISNIKTHYLCGHLHRPVIKIIMTTSRIQLDQIRPPPSPSSGLRLKYIFNCLLSSLTQSRVNSLNTKDSKDTSEIT
jgi:hypothetical protein